MQVPAQILSLSGILKSLDLSFNRISVLSENIALFTNLRTLALNNNKLGEIDTAAWCVTYLLYRISARNPPESGQAAHTSSAAQHLVLSATLHGFPLCT